MSCFLCGHSSTFSIGPPLVSCQLIGGLPLITYAPRGREGGGGQTSYIFLLRITCKIKGGGGGGPDSMSNCERN